MEYTGRDRVVWRNHATVLYGQKSQELYLVPMPRDNGNRVRTGRLTKHILGGLPVIGSPFLTTSLSTS